MDQEPKVDDGHEGVLPAKTESRSRLRRYVGRTLAGIVAVPVVLVGFLHTPPGEALLRARIEQRLGERVSTKATLGGLRFSLVKGIELRDVVFVGNDQRDAIAIERISIVPSWRKLLGGTPTLTLLEVRGLHVDVRAEADGRTNLTGVFVEKKPVAHVVVEKLDMAKVSFSLTKPDGTKVSVRGVSLSGAIDAKPPEKTFSVDLALGIDRIDFEKPGTKVSAQKLATTAHVALVGGAGDVRLGPSTGALELTREGKTPFPVALGLPPISVGLAPGELTLATEAMKVAALSLAVAKAEVRRSPDGELRGEQKLDLTTFEIDAEAVNALAGQRVLAGNLALDVHASGPPEKLGLGLKVTTRGGVVTLTGILDAKERSFAAKLATHDFDLPKVVALETVPPVFVGLLAIEASGKGESKESLDAKVALHLEKARVKGVSVDALDVSARYSRGVLTVDSLALDAFSQSVRGNARYTPETKLVAAQLSTSGSLGVTLAELEKAGVAVPRSPLLGTVSITSPVRLRVDGTTDKGLTVHVDDLSIGAVGGRAHAQGRIDLVPGDPSKGEKRFRADDVDVKLELSGLSLDTIGRLRGRALPVSGSVSGKVHVTGNAAAPDAEFSVAARLAEGAGNLGVKGTSRGGKVEATVTLANREGHELLRTTAEGRIEQKSLSVNAPIALSLDVPKRPLSDFGPLLTSELAEKLPNASASIHAEIHGTPAHPMGDLRIVAEGALIKALAPESQTATVAIHVEPKGAGTHLTASAELVATKGAPNETTKGARGGAALPPLTLVATADLGGPLAQARTASLSWTAKLTVPETALASLPIPPEKKGDLAGSAKVTLDVRGTRKDVALDLTVALRGVSKGLVSGVDADLNAHLEDSRTTAALTTKHHGTPFLSVRAEAALGGKDLLQKKLEGADPEIDLVLDVPRTALSDFIPLAPTAAGFGGTLSVKGRARNPQLAGAFSAEGLRTANGEAVSSTASLEGNLDDLRATLALGKGLALSASVPPRAYLAAKAGEGTVPLTLSLTAKKATLETWLPSAQKLDPYQLKGTFFSDLVARVSLHVKGNEQSVEAIDLQGGLALSGASVTIPGSSRVLDQVALILRGQGNSLGIERLEAHEHDREKADRRVVASGKIGLATRTADLSLEARDMLVFGGNFGQPDAPRASITGKLGVHADISTKLQKVDVRVDSLELSSPDRFARAHEQEVLSLGDVIDLGSGTAVGKLSRTRVASEPPSPVEAPKAPASSGEAPPREPSKSDEEKTLEVVVHVPNTIHVKQKPLDLYARGEIVILRTPQGRTLSGSLVCEKGSLMVGGVEHTLDHGEVRMTNEGPFLDLHFRHDPHPAALRDFSTGQGTALFAHMIGPFGKQKLSFSGVADGLFEALAINNGGRTRVLASPDAPSSQTAQLPQIRELRLTAYMAANLPHLAFLNRMNTLADPSAGRSYGRFQTLEAERYSQDGTRRLRVTSRVPVIGQSDGEVEYDVLFTNTPQIVSGVGVVGGTRAGGGPAVFWEWSSKD